MENFVASARAVFLLAILLVPTTSNAASFGPVYVADDFPARWCADALVKRGVGERVIIDVEKHVAFSRAIPDRTRAALPGIELDWIDSILTGVMTDKLSRRMALALQPYMFTDVRHFADFVRSELFTTMAKDAAQRDNLRYLGLALIDQVVLVSKAPLRRLGDFRSLSGIGIETELIKPNWKVTGERRFEGFFAKFNPGLRESEITESDIASGAAARHDAALIRLGRLERLAGDFKYVDDTLVAVKVGAFVANERIFEKLAPAEQQRIMAAVGEVARECSARNFERGNDTLRKLISAGMQPVQLEDRAELRAKAVAYGLATKWGWLDVDLAAMEKLK